MAESFLIFIIAVVGVIVAILLVCVIAYFSDYIKFFLKTTIGLLLALGLCGGGLALLVNVGGFPGAVGIVLILAGVGLALIIIFTCKDVVREWCDRHF